MSNCKSLIAIEFWLEGELVSNCCSLFMEFENNEYLSASYNDEACIWEITQVRERPKIVSEQRNNEFKYILKEHMPASLKNCGDLESYTVYKRNNLNMKFSSGLEVLLSYNHKLESSEINIKA